MSSKQMRYHHHLGTDAVAQSDSTSFLLARTAGGYCSFGVPNVTRYQGLTSIMPFSDSWELFKSVESITLEEDISADPNVISRGAAIIPDSIVLLPDAVERVSQSAIERFSVTQGSMRYEARKETGVVHIALDMRAIHDFANDGRHYTIQDVPDGHVITYRCPRYSFCLAILGAQGTYRPEWREVHYAYDARRNSLASLWVHDCLSYKFSRNIELRFGTGYNPAEAIRNANDGVPERHILKVPPGCDDAAVHAAIRDLDGLIAMCLPNFGPGILAGYPWFFQVYTRDEAISMGAVIKLGEHALAKRLLLRELDHLRPDGRISNRIPSSEISSADGVGWTFFRLRELVDAGACSSDELRQIHTALKKSIAGLERDHFEDGLITSGWKETWMDTTGGYEDGRPGARIEIQALSAHQYSFMAALCERLDDGDATYYHRKEELLRERTRALFFDAHTYTLADGVDDHVDRTIRPNVFLAAYVYPDLLTRDEWHEVLGHALEHLWLNWGGLSTIDKEHMLFTPKYTGETDKSYHRGDSWYFINNIAAIVLREHGFIEDAEKLFTASREQLLAHGIPGHAAETSSAGNFEAVGCFSQAWSAATFVELWLARQDLSR